MPIKYFILIFVALIGVSIWYNLNAQKEQCVKNTRFYVTGGKLYQCDNYKP